VTDFPPWVWDIPTRFNIGVACTDAHVSGSGAERVAVLVDDDGLGVRQETFAGLADRTSRFVALLRALGIEAGERILVRLPNCIEYPVVFLGAMKAGAIPVPTSLLLTAEEVLHLLTDSGAAAVVIDRASWTALGSALEAVAELRHVLLVGPGDTPPATRVALHDLHAALGEVAPAREPYPTRAEDPAYLVYTSGTTGYPKGVLHAHRALLGRQPSSTYWFDFRPDGDRVLHAGKFNWTYVLGTGLMDPLYRGHTAMVHEGANEPALWPRLIARHGATIFVAVPTIYRQILQKTACTRADVPSLRHCMSAGEQLSADVLGAWRERFGLEIYEGLGMTECSYYLCETRSRPIRPGSAGFAQPGHAIALLDPRAWRPVGVQDEGMICIPRDDPGLMLRYWNRPDETAACFHGDWFLTGDYARRDADGYFWFLGRRDDLINSFGYRVSPHEVERILKDHPDVLDAAVAAESIAPEKVLVVAYAVCRPGSAASADAIASYARTRLAAYKAPRIVYLVHDLPRTRNGKLLRRDLSPALAHARSV
jgi:acetyl-CoA synthetase